MDQDLYDQIKQAITDRERWETRQATFYKMFNGGIPRRSMPYKGAPDQRFPLSASTWEKLKPFYVGQLYTGETFASFISLKQQDEGQTTSAGYYFDYVLKQKSNFEREIMHAIHGMGQTGFNPVKARWDADNKRLGFDGCDPTHVIVPKWTEEIGAADWLIHVIPMSVAQYKANPRFNQDEQFIESIRGKGIKSNDGLGSGETEKESAKNIREGITYGRNENEIIIWELYKRDEQQRITIETGAAVLLSKGDPDKWKVRGDMQLPYDKGVFSSGKRMPFGVIRTEIKDKGHYAPRGIPERQAPFEVSMCKTWNKIHEWMDFFVQPCFEQTKPMSGTASNFQRRPGGIVPDGLKSADVPQLPAMLPEQMEYTRAAAEQLVQLPDLGASQHLAPSGNTQGGKVTATQINAIVGQSGQGNDIRARVFRMDLGDIFNLAWSIMLQYCIPLGGQETLQFLMNGKLEAIDPQALHDLYLIVPNGSPDGWNKSAEVGKATMVFQTLTGNPYVDQGELTKYLLEKIDPPLVNRLYQDPGDHQRKEGQQQALEILLMENKFAAEVEPADDDKAHLGFYQQWFPVRMQEQPPLSAISAGLNAQHIKGHLSALQEKKDPMFSQAVQMAKEPLMILDAIAQQGQPNNVVPMQSQQQLSSGAAPMASTGTAEAPDPISDGTKILNSLATLIGKGVPITLEQLNTEFAKIGVPPLPETQPITPQTATV